MEERARLSRGSDNFAIMAPSTAVRITDVFPASLQKVLSCQLMRGYLRFFESLFINSVLDERFIILFGNEVNVTKLFIPLSIEENCVAQFYLRRDCKQSLPNGKAPKCFTVYNNGLSYNGIILFFLERLL